MRDDFEVFFFQLNAVLVVYGFCVFFLKFSVSSVFSTFHPASLLFFFVFVIYCLENLLCLGQWAASTTTHNEFCNG